MASNVMWMAATGLAPSRMINHLPARSTKREAMADMDAAELRYPISHAQVARLEFGSPLQPATRVDIVATRCANATAAAA